MDLLDEMSKAPDMANITFNVSVVPDGKYGSYVNRQWDGMIKELVDEVRVQCSIQNSDSLRDMCTTAKHIRSHRLMRYSATCEA